MEESNSANKRLMIIVACFVLLVVLLAAIIFFGSRKRSVKKIGGKIVPQEIKEPLLSESEKGLSEQKIQDITLKERKKAGDIAFLRDKRRYFPGEEVEVLLTVNLKDMESDFSSADLIISYSQDKAEIVKEKISNEDGKDYLVYPFQKEPGIIIFTVVAKPGKKVSQIRIPLVFVLKDQGGEVKLLKEHGRDRSYALDVEEREYYFDEGSSAL